MDEREKIIVDIARIIWKYEISISEFYMHLGIDIDDVARSDVDNSISELSGICKGWQNPPNEG